jgi:hypothetical protein
MTRHITLRCVTHLNQHGLLRKGCLCLGRHSAGNDQSTIFLHKKEKEKKEKRVASVWADTQQETTSPLSSSTPVVVFRDPGLGFRGLRFRVYGLENQSV